MRLAFIPSPTDRGANRGNWRGLLLARAIQETRHATAGVVDPQVILDPDCSDQTICANADMIVLQANPHPAVLETIQRWKSRDKTVILDLGPEHYISEANTSPKNSSQIAWNGLAPTIQMAEMIQWGLRLVDGVILSSQRMIEDLRGLANGILIPEYIDLERYLTLGPVTHAGIVLGWKNDSFDAHGMIASGLKDALEHLCQVRPEVRLHIFGGDPAITEEFALPPEKVSYFPLANPDDWPALLSGVDIGVAPLYGVRDERRGWGDVLEFMAMKIPWVASHGPAYYELRPYGWIIQNNASTWERVLLDVIDHLPAYAEEAQGEPYLFAISQGIEENVESVLATFSEIQGKSQTLRPPNETR